MLRVSDPVRTRGILSLTEQVQQLIRVGDQQVALPDGISLSQWTLEKYRWQNPRIRSLLGCIRLLEGVLESNYAILHCSPARLHEIWRQVLQVADLIRTELADLLEYPSVIPQLEEARKSIQSSMELLSSNVLEEIEQFPTEDAVGSMMEERKLLCVSIGKLNAFLQDTFGEIVAADPRSIHDADYFLSRRFPRDIEEAEWLYASVEDLRSYLRELEQVRYRRLTEVISVIRRDLTLPIAETWRELDEFLHLLLEGLTPRLNEMLALRGIRFDEMEILDRYAQTVPTGARLILELGSTGRKAIDFIKDGLGDSDGERAQNLRDLIDLHAVLSRRIIALLSQIDRSLQDLWLFIPIWLQNIEKRRALLLRGEIEDSGDGFRNLQELVVRQALPPAGSETSESSTRTAPGKHGRTTRPPC